jgi:hypothetical protein
MQTGIWGILVYHIPHFRTMPYSKKTHDWCLEVLHPSASFGASLGHTGSNLKQPVNIVNQSELQLQSSTTYQHKMRMILGSEKTRFRDPESVGAWGLVLSAFGWHSALVEDHSRAIGRFHWTWSVQTSNPFTDRFWNLHTQELILSSVGIECEAVQSRLRWIAFLWWLCRSSPWCRLHAVSPQLARL